PGPGVADLGAPRAAGRPRGVHAEQGHREQAALLDPLHARAGPAPPGPATGLVVGSRRPGPGPPRIDGHGSPPPLTFGPFGAPPDRGRDGPLPRQPPPPRSGARVRHAPPSIVFFGSRAPLP